MTEVTPDPVCADRPPQLTPEEQAEWDRKVAEGDILPVDAE
jgi:hypothetical protein